MASLIGNSYFQRQELKLFQLVLTVQATDGGADIEVVIDFPMPRDANVCHLTYRLPPFGYGKEILKGHFKIYLTDAAIAPAVLLKGKSIINDASALGVVAETAVFKHLFARYYAQNVRFTYWRGKQDRDVDLVAEKHG